MADVPITQESGALTLKEAQGVVRKGERVLTRQDFYTGILNKDPAAPIPRSAIPKLEQAYQNYVMLESHRNIDAQRRAAYKKIEQGVSKAVGVTDAAKQLASILDVAGKWNREWEGLQARKQTTAGNMFPDDEEGRTKWMRTHSAAGEQQLKRAWLHIVKLFEQNNSERLKMTPQEMGDQAKRLMAQRNGMGSRPRSGISAPNITANITAPPQMQPPGQQQPIQGPSTPGIARNPQTGEVLIFDEETQQWRKPRSQPRQ